MSQIASPLPYLCPRPLYSRPLPCSQRVDYALTLAVEIPASDVSPTEVLVHRHDRLSAASQPSTGRVAGALARFTCFYSPFPPSVYSTGWSTCK
jgi:hypothetical protein